MNAIIKVIANIKNIEKETEAMKNIGHILLLMTMTVTLEVKGENQGLDQDLVTENQENVSPEEIKIR